MDLKNCLLASSQREWRDGIPGMPKARIHGMPMATGKMIWSVRCCIAS